MTCLHQLIEFANMQLAYRHDERPGESYKALDGKKLFMRTKWEEGVLVAVLLVFGFLLALFVFVGFFSVSFCIVTAFWLCTGPISALLLRSIFSTRWINFNASKQKKHIACRVWIDPAKAKRRLVGKKGKRVECSVDIPIG